MPKPQLPKQVPSPGQANKQRGILELDRFTEQDLHRWSTASRGLDELNDILYFGLQPERRRLRAQLIAGVQNAVSLDLSIRRWVRLITFRYSNVPLSCAGSLQYIGGRFNAGAELEPGTLAPWPALYLAENFETAFREKFQLKHDEKVDGLTPREMALEGAESHTQKKLGIGSNGVYMVKTGKQIHDMVLHQNWRTLPVQFGLPAPSQIVAELIRASGYEAILYSSSKGLGKCLAVYPDLLADGSYIELADTPPPGVHITRMDHETAADLEGWSSLPHQLRAK